MNTKAILAGTFLTAFFAVQSASAANDDYFVENAAFTTSEPVFIQKAIYLTDVKTETDNDTDRDQVLSGRR